MNLPNIVFKFKTTVPFRITNILLCLKRFERNFSDLIILNQQINYLYLILYIKSPNIFFLNSLGSLINSFDKGDVIGSIFRASFIF